VGGQGKERKQKNSRTPRLSFHEIVMQTLLQQSQEWRLITQFRGKNLAQSNKTQEAHATQPPPFIGLADIFQNPWRLLYRPQ
jgi:hypothetical protein